MTSSSNAHLDGFEDVYRRRASFRFTDHAARRSQQRGIRRQIVDFVVGAADHEQHVGSKCVSYWISKKECERLRKAGVPGRLLDRAAKVVVIADPRDGAVVTAMHGYRSHARRGH